MDNYTESFIQNNRNTNVIYFINNTLYKRVYTTN